MICDYVSNNLKNRLREIGRNKDYTKTFLVSRPDFKISVGLGQCSSEAGIVVTSHPRFDPKLVLLFVQSFFIFSLCLSYLKLFFFHFTEI